MKKLSKIKLQDAVVLEDREMKTIFGGASNGCASASGYVCYEIQCSDIVGDRLVFGRCQWVTMPWGNTCACVVTKV